MNKKSNLEASQCCLLFPVHTCNSGTRQSYATKRLFLSKKSFRVYLSGIELHVFLFLRESSVTNQKMEYFDESLRKKLVSSKNRSIRDQEGDVTSAQSGYCADHNEQLISSVGS